MLQYPQIDPIAIAIGPLQIHWYGSYCQILCMAGQAAVLSD